jgi:hypothetical protein
MIQALSQARIARIPTSILGLIAFFMVGVGGIGLACAQSPLSSVPVYDPASKSYFDLLRITKAEERFSERRTNEVTWHVAQWLAEHKQYKGVPGRLAIIRSADTYFFLLKTFRSELPTWIGLRYICGARELRWVDGKLQPRNGFEAWRKQWNGAIPGAQCRPPGAGGPPYMPIVVTPASQGFRWYAQGIAKEYQQYFIEFPTGHP